MNVYLIVTVSVLVAAFIGGLTNHLAIRMLFHPRQAWSLFGRRVPFTPGLIPKRREEIAGSLGRVVADYLVTSDGLSEMLRKQEFRNSIELKLLDSIIRLSEREETLDVWCSRIWTGDRFVQVKSQFIHLLNEMSIRGIDWLWDDKGWSKVRLVSLMPDWTTQHKQQLAQKGVQYIVDVIRQEMASANGDRLIRSLTKQLLDQAGGFLGALAGIFMDEDKISMKVRHALSEALESHIVHSALEEFIIRQINRVEEMTLEELANVVVDSGAKSWVIRKLQWEDWTEKLLSIRMDELVNKHRIWIEEQVPKLVQFGLNLLDNHVDQILRSLQLEQLVEKQVKFFPVERLEEIILSISGRELRAITWLGALLGGMIGLFQAVLLRWIG